MGGFDPEQVYSSIDRGGRYAYGNRPAIAQWNRARLAETLLELIDTDVAAAVEKAKAIQRLLDTLCAMRRKLGLASARSGDLDLIEGLLGTMARARSDFTLTLRHLCTAAAGEDAAIRELFTDPANIAAWLAAWRERLAAEGGDEAGRAARMVRANPPFIPRNHRVEEAIRAGIANDFGPFERPRRCLRGPRQSTPHTCEGRPGSSLRWARLTASTILDQLTIAARRFLEPLVPGTKVLESCNLLVLISRHSRAPRSTA